MLAIGKSLCLHKYSIDHLDDAKDDLRRLQNHSKYKLVKQFDQEKAQTTTSFAHANSFFSTIVVAAGSNRSVTLYDLGQGSGVVHSIIPDAHARSVIGCALPSFSQYTNHPNNAYDVFLTAGAEGTVKLWDVRDFSHQRPVRTFTSQARSTAMSLDPTMRHLACVSRDSPNVVSVYDIRGGALVESIHCGAEAVCDVAFSPRHPQLCVASADGRVRFFAA